MNGTKTFCLLLPLLLIASCSLDPDDSAGTAIPSLRLLVDGTNTTMLSDPAANDWSPQIQTHYTIPYIYFVSDRIFSGLDFMGAPITTGPGTNGLFRAQMIGTGTFSNLECIYAFPAGYRVKSIVVPRLEGLVLASVSSNDTTPFRLYRVENAEGWTGYWSSLLSSPYSIDLAGYTEIYSTGYIYISYVTTISLFSNVRVLEPLQVPPTRSESFIRTFRQIPFNFIMKRKLSLPGEIGDVWPLALPSKKQEGKNVFGFICSWGGVLSLGVDVYLSNSEDSFNQNQSALEVLENSQNAMDTKRALPLFWITHYPGTMDRTPSFDPATGLYFASTRDGFDLYNLYYVPLPYLSIPDDLVIPEQQFSDLR